MNFKYLCTIFLILLSKFAFSQLRLYHYSNVKNYQIKIDSGKSFFAGGLNAGQYGKIDLNYDNIDDLVIFEKSTNSLQTYLSINNQYIFHPEYISLFPVLNDWVLFKDFDNDSRTDIFTHTALGIKVYRNISGSNGILNWTTFADPLLSKGFSGMVNIQINGTDLPAINDIDNDGDLDILCYNFFDGSHIEYHLNQSIELFNNTDSLKFKRVDDCWGGLTEINCGNFNFSSNCPTGLRLENKRIKHVAASSMLAIDLDGDNDCELIESKELCTNLNYLINKGSKTSASFNKVDTTYPDGIKRNDFPVSPSAFYLDINQDGLKDMIVSTNSPFNYSNIYNYKKTSFVYLNNGTNSKPNFVFSDSNFIQKGMMDVGENASTIFHDIDNDNDLDIIVGNRGEFDSISKSFRASLYHYENVGNSLKAIYKEVNQNLFNLSQLKLTNLKPQIIDLNNDNLLDLIFCASIKSNHKFYYILNTGSLSNWNFNLQDTISKSYFSLNSNDNITFYDINKDGLQDIILAKYNGKIQSWLRSNDSIGYILDKSNLANFDNFISSNPVITIKDLNNDSKNDLIVSDFSGKIYLFSDIENIYSLNTISKSDTFTIDKSNFSNNSYSSSGNPTSITAIDINNDGNQEIVIGNMAGGANIYSTIPEDSIVPNNSFSLLKVYPNPNHSSTFKFETDDETQCFLYDISGKQIDNFIVPEFTKKDYTLNIHANGVYILKSISSKGTQVLKLVKK